MTNPTHVKNYDRSKFWVDPGRNFKSSARLHLQHFLVQNTIGYILEPAIACEKSTANFQQKQQLKIADLACGNGIWLTELHSTLARANLSAQLDGLDINPVNFPASAYLPPSTSLKQLDILARPLPAELVGVYDIVHIRAFVSVIADSNLTPVLSAASQLLRPGAFLQWEELQGDAFTVQSPSPHISKVACEKVVQILEEGSRAKGIRNDWVDTLDTHLSKFGFQNTRLHRHEKRRQDFKGWTDDYLMVWDELAVFFPPQSQEPNAQLTREAWLDLYAAAIKETEQGVVIHKGAVVVAVGQKPL